MKKWTWPTDLHGASNGRTRHWPIVAGVLTALFILGWVSMPLATPERSALTGSQGFTLIPLPESDEPLNLDQATDGLVNAIIQIESQGNPTLVGTVGERGLMQIREDTWKEVTQRHFGKEIDFDLAFDPEMNRRVGRYYLGDLQIYLYENREHWRSDLRSLILACYNAGPERVRQSGFNLKKLPKVVQSYAERGSALHDWTLNTDAETMHKLLIEAAEVEENATP